MNDLEMVETNTGVMPAQQIIERINVVNDIVKKVMVENTHFGKIPGCGSKPTLLKSGAEVLALAFNLDLQSETEVLELARGHREYRCTTIAYNKATGMRVGNGEGCATTMESKWRFRAENTGALVPKEYWKERNNELIGGSEFSTRKVDGTWYIFHKVEHDNPADYYNTCLKMAEKRSRVACTLNVTAASNLFTQDIEDMVDIIELETKKTALTKTVKKTEHKSKEPVEEGNAQSPNVENGDGETITGIEEITVKAGTTKKGKPYTRYNIKGANGEIYSTFDKKLADVAKEIQKHGEEALIIFEVTEYGKNALDVQRLDAGANG